MEGTRNEKIIIVISAYIIGFTTSFIAFGLETPNQTEVPQSQEQHVHAQVEKFDASLETISSIETNDDGLFIVTDGYSRLLSAKRGSLGASLIASVPTPGFHTKIIAASLSKDLKFVYFCEQQIPDTQKCSPYVYSLLDDSSHVVKLNGAVFEQAIEGHTAVWTDNNLLVLNENLTSNPQKPWEFLAVEEAKTSPQEEPQAKPIEPATLPAEHQSEVPTPTDAELQVQ